MRSSRENDPARVRHIYDAVQQCVRLTQGRTRADMDTDDLFALAMARLLEIIGEAASQVTVEFRAAHPEIPWRAMIGMRNIVIHAYFEVDRDVIWQTISEDIPPLEPLLAVLLTDIKGNA